MSGKEGVMAKWTDALTVDTLPEQYQHLAQTIGVQNLLKLADQFGGEKYYIPKREALLRGARNRMIRKQYTGYNAKELAKCYNLTERWVIRICQGAEDTDSPLAENQEKIEERCDMANNQIAIWEVI